MCSKEIIINTISILGSGWLGLPLATILYKQAFRVRASTRHHERFTELDATGARAFHVDIDQLSEISEFLDSEILIINITSKNINGFARLIEQIETSPIQKVLFISSTSVYQNLNREVTEDENAEDHNSVLWQIEQLFQNNTHFKTTIVRFSGLIDSRRHPGRFFRNGRSVPQADAHPSKREFYGYARKLMGLSPPEFDTETEIKYKIISNQKVKSKLNYTFQHPDLMKITF